MNKEDKFISWLCGKGKFPFFQDKSPCEDIKVKDELIDEELTDEERIKYQADPDILTDVKITNFNEPYLNK